MIQIDNYVPQHFYIRTNTEWVSQNVEIEIYFYLIERFTAFTELHWTQMAYIHLVVLYIFDMYETLHFFQNLEINLWGWSRPQAGIH